MITDDEIAQLSVKAGFYPDFGNMTLSVSVDDFYLFSRELIALAQEVKELEWKDYGARERAVTAFGCYYTEDTYDGEFVLLFEDDIEIGYYQENDEAKAAAQADFERRVKECLK